MRLLLAPIQGMTVAFYRNLYAEYFGNIDEYYSPFITTTDVINIGASLLNDILPENNDPSLKVVPQLLGNNGSHFKNYASHITNLGYNEINWNIGCPYPTVTKKNRGAGLLSHPEMIQQFLDIVCSDKPYDLTVKMRLGLNSLDEGKSIIKILNDYPIKGITIHGRTGDQKYTGTVDLDGFETLYALSNHDVTYNGDIFTPEDFSRIQERFSNITDFMLARGALKNPFLPGEIKGNFITKEEKIVTLKAFHDDVYGQYKKILSGDKHLCDRMKEFWTYLSVTIDPTGKYMKKIRKARTSKVYLEVINAMFISASNID